MFKIQCKSNHLERIIQNSPIHGVIYKIWEYQANKKAAAICAAPSVFAGLGLLEGKPATCHPDFEGKMHGAVLTGDPVTHSGNIITGRGLGATMDFALYIAEILAGEEKAAGIARSICYKM